MALRIEKLCQRQFTIRPGMPITGQSFLISQRAFGSGVCDVLNSPDKRNAFWVYAQPCTIYSILVITWYQPGIIGFYECEPLRRGNILQCEPAFLIGITEAGAGFVFESAALERKA